MRETEFESRELCDADLEGVCGGKQRPSAVVAAKKRVGGVVPMAPMAPMPKAAAAPKVCGPGGCK